MTSWGMYAMGGLDTLGLMNLPQLISLTLKDATIADPWFPRAKTTSQEQRQ